MNETRQGVTSTALAAAPVSPSVVSTSTRGDTGASRVKFLSVEKLTLSVGDSVGATNVELCLLDGQTFLLNTDALCFLTIERTDVEPGDGSTTSLSSET